MAVETRPLKTVRLVDVTVPAHHRAIKPWSLERIKASIASHGFNPAYPIVLDDNGDLVDGNHRLTAARAQGIEELPYIVKPSHISAVRFGLQCNADGQLCAADDVFDLAELCYGLSQDGWTGQRIADELGWDRTRVVQHTAIKSGLHSSAWQLARYGVTANHNSVTGASDESVTPDVTGVTPWTERHFRALLKHVSWDGQRPTMRAQLKAISAVLKQLEAIGRLLPGPTVEKVAIRHAWQAKLAIYSRDHLVKEVGIRDRIGLLKAVYGNVFGDEPTDKNQTKFAKAVAALNERALGIRLYCDDAFQRIPTLKDGSIALILTDPPYNTTDHEWDRIGTPEDYVAWTDRWLSSLRPKLAIDYHAFIFCSQQYAARIERLLDKRDWPLKSRIIWWHRNLATSKHPDSQYAETWDMVFHIGTHSLNWAPEWSDECFDVQQFAIPQRNFSADKGQVPTPKPVDLLARLIQHGSKPGDLILDPFAGGGSTGEASRQVGQRRCVLIERDDAFCQVIERRLEIQRVREG